MIINFVRLGLTDYSDALEIQKKLQLLRQQCKIEDVLLLLEHPPVLTLGSGGKHSNILLSKMELEAKGVKIFETNRGGDVTYHGPGQIVGYLIMDLNNYGKDLTNFVGRICQVFTELLKEEYNIDAKRDRGKYTGVWVGNEKITAIGISVKHWVTMHGFAFNVNTQMEHFKWINPCGIKDKGVTSLQKILGTCQNFDTLNEKVLKYFCKEFDLEPLNTDINSLIYGNIQNI